MASFIRFFKGRKNLLFITSILFLILTGCTSQEKPREIEYKPYTLAELAKQDFANVNKIEIVNGETGEEKTVEDVEQVKEFIRNMEDAYFKPDFDQQPRKGWEYFITFYEDRKKVFEFYTNYIDNIYFKPDEKVMAAVEQLFNSK
ncbi:hypothetical protein [Calidifontibacillus erzurumensis]|uniref:Lipoprotein n=1 Tax=Calidifontibacillus erzurumensis TaxID=2741433 RepID=A0A8J8GEK5_9BACI|nr:hypothetical protein [Calidifontibacillus erzurumensis]NSL52444.1 hypothetical protein [Calidifontibacillus erzurumensis]